MVNLISVSALAKQNVNTTFDQNLNFTCYHTVSKQIILEARCNANGLYEIETALAATMWHERLGHPSNEVLKKTCQLNKLEVNYPGFCEICAQAKATAASFPTSNREYKEVGDLVVSDVKGPFPVPSISNHRYYVSFIEAKTRFATVYLLKHKSEVFECFKRYEQLFQRQTGKQIKRIRSDNGGEYTSNEFSSYLQTSGMIHETTVPHSPQQNGIAERYNRTLMTKFRCLLISSKLPERFWSELILSAVYLINRLPRQSENDKTPYEDFFNVKPDLSNLRAIGSAAYSLNTSPKKTIFDERATKGFLVGYCPNQKGWRIFLPSTGKIIVSRSVRFNENEQFTNSNQNLDCLKITELPKQESTLIDLNLPDDDEEEGENEPDDHEIKQLNSNLGTYWQPPTGPRRANIIQIALAARLVNEDTPTTFSEAHESPESPEWTIAEESEMTSLKENDVYEWVPRPPSRSVIKSRWVYDIKRNPDGILIKKESSLCRQRIFTNTRF